MPATASSNKRLRQIAILLSSVDSATARQLLLHLPTETARQVRSLAGKLGPVSAEEKRRILADFQRTAAASASSQPNTAGTNASSAPTQPQRPDSLTTSQAADPYDLSYDPPPQEEAMAETKWGNLSSQGLLKFLRGERPAVIAVVVSQLTPQLAVQVLQDLPIAVNREVLQRISGLGEIDTDALSSIEEYLSERLEEYQKTVRSESENQKRINALLAAAPMALREQWQSVLAGTDQAEADQRQTASPQSPQVEAEQQTVASPAEDIENPAVQAARNVEDTFQPQSTQEDQESEATILPFPGAEQRTALQSGSHEYIADSSLIRLEFESLLELPPETLAIVLSEPDSQTVLLALAGATPAFMQRFYDMLRPEDAIALKSRLTDIGAIHLRDIDQAQQELIELAARLGASQRQYAGQETRQRQAA
ncbi:MAG: hypothetical protein Aurels2KO_23860 [Aureliella sp.]